MGDEGHASSEVVASSSRMKWRLAYDEMVGLAAAAVKLVAVNQEVAGDEVLEVAFLQFVFSL